MKCLKHSTGQVCARQSQRGFPTQPTLSIFPIHDLQLRSLLDRRPFRGFGIVPDRPTPSLLSRTDPAYYHGRQRVATCAGE